MRIEVEANLHKTIQLTFTYAKLTIETLQKGVKYV